MFLTLCLNGITFEYEIGDSRKIEHKMKDSDDNEDPTNYVIEE
jgi:hypothetical protein